MSRRSQFPGFAAMAAACAAVAALALCSRPASAEPLAEALPMGEPAFALVSYTRPHEGGPLGADVLDTGLTADDCAGALLMASEFERPSQEALLTCEPAHVEPLDTCAAEAAALSPPAYDEPRPWRDRIAPPPVSAPHGGSDYAGR